MPPLRIPLPDLVLVSKRFCFEAKHYCWPTIDLTILSFVFNIVKALSKITFMTRPIRYHDHLMKVLKYISISKHSTLIQLCDPSTFQTATIFSQVQTANRLPSTRPFAIFTFSLLQQKSIFVQRLRFAFITLCQCVIALDQGFSTFILSFTPWQISKVKFTPKCFLYFHFYKCLL